MWVANWSVRGDYFSLQCPLGAQSDAWGATSHLTAPPFQALLHFVPFNKAQGSALQGITSPGLSQGLSSAFIVLLPLTPYCSPPRFPVQSHSSFFPFGLLSTDFLASPELDDSNTIPSVELVPVLVLTLNHRKSPPHFLCRETEA